MRFCGNCGKPVKEGAKFCNACGAKLKPVAAAQPVPVPEIVEEAPPVEETAVASEVVEETPAVAEPEAAPEAVEETPTAAEPEAAPEAVEETPAAAEPEAAPEAAEETPAAAEPEAAPEAVEETPAVAEPKAAPKKRKEKPAKKGKKGKGGLVLLIVLLILAVLGTGTFFGYRWYNSPEQRSLRALENTDYGQIEDILEADESLAQNEKLIQALKTRVEAVKKAFTKDKENYADTLKELAKIKELQIPAMDAVLAEAEAYTNALNQSRLDFAAAEDALAKGDFVLAMEKYAKVVEADSNYQIAKQQLHEATTKYRNQLMTQAQTLVTDGDFDGAIALLKGGLGVLPEDQNLTDQIAAYEKLKTETVLNTAMDEATGLAAVGKFDEAIEVLKTALQKLPGNETLTTQISAFETAKVDKFRKDTLTQAAAYATAKNYEKAIEILGNALAQMPGDETLTNQLTVYQQEMAAKIEADALAKAAELAGKDDYVGAMDALTQAMTVLGDDPELKAAHSVYHQKYLAAVFAKVDEYTKNGQYESAVLYLRKMLEATPDDAQLIARLAVCEDAFVTDTVTLVDAALAGKKYAEAMALVEQALTTMPEDETLLAKKVEVDEATPKSFLSVCPPFKKNSYYKAFTDGKTFSMAGKAYTDGFTLAEKAEIVSNLDAQYNQLFFTLGHDDSTDYYNLAISIYLDDVLYFTYEVDSNALPRDVIIPVTGVKLLRIVTGTASGTPKIGLGNVLVSKSEMGAVTNLVTVHFAHGDGTEKTVNLLTEKTNLAEILTAGGYITAEQTDDGYVIQTADGETAADGASWSFYVGDTLSDAAVNAVTVENGAVYQLVYVPAPAAEPEVPTVPEPSAA